MPLEKIQVHEVDTNLTQAKESADAVVKLQYELEDILAAYNDNSKRYAAGELSREEFLDLTRSKEEAVRDINLKVENNISVILTSLDTIRKITGVQEHSDEVAEKAAGPQKLRVKRVVKPVVHKSSKRQVHKAAKHHTKHAVKHNKHKAAAHRAKKK